ncbi:hypothetical protein A3L04_02625 [Thermococcus chitonophagus]|uniref:ATPase domain-containing protein n=2 Tax=Thermococcus chitonophagus TaxID=54262 RepID=A0A2Z2N6T7_9EURY|nr:hypothetical protein A3L04_02625 [Thermococcus chitonophagus]
MLLGRNVCKTTLVKVLLNEIDNSGVYIDARKLWNAHANMSLNVIKIESLDARKRYALVMRLFRSLRSVTIAGSGVGFKDKNIDLIDVLDDIENSGERRVIFLMRRNISADKVLRYLKEGFAEVGMSVPDEEIEDAVEVLDGIVGWLREYGWLRYRGKTHSSAIDEIFQKAREDIIDELSRYSSRYLRITMAISEGYNTWSAIKAYLERIEGKRIDKKTLYTAYTAM